MSRPTLLLHGLPFDARIWRPVTTALSGDGRRYVALDLPGYGASPPLDADWSVAAHAAWIDAARVARDLPDGPGLHLVGHEYGGLLAAFIAAERGAASLTLLSTTLGPAWLTARVAAWPGLHRIFYRRYGGTLYRDRAVAPADRPALARDFPMPGTRAFADQMRATGRQLPARALLTLERRLRRRLVRAPFPVRLLWGSDDRTFPPAVGRRLARALPGASLTLIPGARHLAPWTHGVEVAASLRARSR